MSHYDRFDIVDAHYWFACDYHSGQTSDLYSRLSRISKYFKPPILATGPTGENSRAIYRELVKKHEEKHNRSHNL